ncbi:hypothetical protein [Cellulomonas phragmiteti]|nr:hypothetical protein [Cellulomonas phragmiteti]
MRALKATVAVVALLLVASCSGEDDAAGPEASGPTSWDITAVDGIDGATRESVDGIGIDVPADFEGDPRQVDGTTSQLVLMREGEERSEVNLTVTREDDLTDDAVTAAAGTAFAQLGATGSASDLEQVPLRWEGFGNAIAVRGVLTLEDGTERDVEYVTTRDPDGTRLVAVWTEAPRGELEGSTAQEVLRSVRVDG